MSKRRRGSSSDPLIFAKIFDAVLEELRPVLGAERLPRSTLAGAEARDALRLIEKHKAAIRGGDLSAVKSGIIRICRTSDRVGSQQYLDLCRFAIVECMAVFRAELSAPGDLSGVRDSWEPGGKTIMEGNLVSTVEADNRKKRLGLSK